MTEVAPAHPRIRALAVDDDPDDRQTMIRLGRYGVECTAIPPPHPAEFRKSVFKLIDDGTVDIVLLDFRLDDQSTAGSGPASYRGGTLAAAIRERYPETPIVLVTTEEKRKEYVEGNPGVRGLFDHTLLKSTIGGRGQCRQTAAHEIVDLATGFRRIREALASPRPEGAARQLLGIDNGELKVSPPMSAQPSRTPARHSLGGCCTRSSPTRGRCSMPQRHRHAWGSPALPSTASPCTSGSALPATRVSSPSSIRAGGRLASCRASSYWPGTQPTGSPAPPPSHARSPIRASRQRGVRTAKAEPCCGFATCAAVPSTRPTIFPSASTPVLRGPCRPWCASAVSRRVATRIRPFATGPARTASSINSGTPGEQVVARDDGYCCFKARDDLVGALGKLRDYRLVTNFLSDEEAKSLVRCCKPCRGRTPNPRKCSGWSIAFDGSRVIELAQFSVEGRSLVARVCGHLDFTRQTAPRGDEGWKERPARESNCAIEIWDAVEHRARKLQWHATISTLRIRARKDPSGTSSSAGRSIVASARNENGSTSPAGQARRWT